MFTLVLAVLLSVPFIPGTPAANTLMARLASHSIMLVMLRSLLLDTGNTLFPIALRAVLATLPYAPQVLTRHTPLLMIILGRAACWIDRPFIDAGASVRDGVTRTPSPNPALRWNLATSAMEIPIDAPLNLQPPRIVRLWIVAVYNAWPSNVIAFLRDPVSYLRGKEVEAVYDISWDSVWQTGLLAARAGPLLRRFQLHPSLIIFTSAMELADEKRWERVEPSDFVTRSHELAHSELLSGERFDFLDGWPEPEHQGKALILPDGGISQLTVNSDLDRVVQENALLRIEAAFADRVRKQYLYRGSRSNYSADSRYRSTS